MRFQNATTNHGGRRYLPYVYTEHGIIALAGVIKSEIADKMSVEIARKFIGANVVVASDILPYSVAVGNPAKVIRKRFDDEMIELLEKLQWWNKTPNQIQKIIPLLSNSDIEYVKEELQNYLN